MFLDNDFERTRIEIGSLIAINQSGRQDYDFPGSDEYEYSNQPDPSSHYHVEQESNLYFF